MSSCPYDFSGKVALVTGSSSGIGEAIAKQLAHYGANITITGRNADALDRIAKEIAEKTNRQPLKIVGDLLQDEFLEQLIQKTIEHFGRLDILVNNAGTGFPKDTFENERLLPEFDKMFTLNVRTPMRLIQLARIHLEKTKGNVINISSNASFEPILFTYSITKAAMDMLTKGAAQELGPKGIRVNSINPGPTVTGMGRAIGEDETFFERSKDKFKQLTILNRIQYPEEVANLATFLASDQAVNITGSIMVSDGGHLVKKRYYFGKNS